MAHNAQDNYGSKLRIQEKKIYVSQVRHCYSNLSFVALLASLSNRIPNGVNLRHDLSSVCPCYDNKGRSCEIANYN